ncbi:rRNA maturation RNase YbeY [Hasllibacter sp. MH4015]|uniref:rRNA maturation RNase YbeY n=1 Tax=Hasllibacter sp. MH4015 TaxID=2854029 RepID=UPI001CD3480C|nr:rRNA maturation RNase YbeY [Hasllibacter sp. MH4015]
MEIDILIEAPAWDAVALEELAQTAAEATLRELALEPEHFALSVLACDDARIAVLNAEFRGKQTPTNVLSWPATDCASAIAGQMPDLPAPDPVGPPEEIGDIALAFETCAREADEAGKTLPHHLSHLIVHGVLHCLGFDHETDPDAALMEGLETRILARLGVPDPY